MSDANNNTHINVDALNSRVSKRTRKIEEYIKITKQRIEKSIEVTKYLNEGLEAITNFPFTEGDVVVVKNKGKGIIVGIEWGNQEAFNIDDKFAEKFYAVVATKDGYEMILLPDIMPYNTTTKVLYERKNE